MRHVLRGPGFAGLLLLGLTLGPFPALGAGFVIDPDPNSATLGELLDREARRNGPRPALKPVPAPPLARDAPAVDAPPAAGPRAGARPIIPRGAVTVLTPRARPRAEPLPPTRKMP